MKYLLKPSLIPLLLVFATTGFYAPSASAHGEKSQAAFMRMRTIHWYDLNWSKEILAVNDTMTISGKFLVFAGWPETVDKPEVAFLNIGIPGPVFIRAGSWIGGQLVPRSVSLELGETYEFKVLLKARRPGDWHVHTMMNVEGGGPIIGPGKWVTITGSMKSFTNPITTLTGQTIDLETYNLGNTYFWHAFWYAVGLAWMAYWLRKPVYIPRIIAVDAGKADSLITGTDKKVGLAFLVGSVAIVAFSMQSTNSQYPITTPLQAGLLRSMKPLEMPTPTVSVKVDDATYHIPDRAVYMKLTVINYGVSAVRLGEFNTAGVRFLDANVTEDTTNYPDDLLAPEGLTVSDNSPLAPGQSRTIQVTASDAAWEVYRLADLIYDPDSRFAGLLFFVDEAGGRQIVQVDAKLSPSSAEIPKSTKIVVFYGTDRKPTGSTLPSEFYGHKSGKLVYGTCEVSIPPGHKMANLESPKLWKLEFQMDPQKHVVLKGVSELPEKDFFSKLKSRINLSDEKEAFVFIHGYNTTFEDAARRTAQMAYDLGFNANVVKDHGAPIFYSWPSLGNAISLKPFYFTPYTADEASVKRSVPKLKEFLLKISSETNALTIHLIAHSMGSEALTSALIEIENDQREVRAFKQIVLAAPDIDAEIFKTQIVPKIKGVNKRITLYTSSNDEAMEDSREFHDDNPRAGDSKGGIVTVPGMDTIDASAVCTSFVVLGLGDWGHSCYGDNRTVLTDIELLLNNGSPPSKRNLLEREQDGTKYWVIRP